MEKVKIIFVGNYKGGVGKTTSVLNFAEHFSKVNKKVLVIDIDPQSSLSEILVSNNGQQLINYVKPQANFQPIFSYLGKWR